ncbi:transglutaminase-like cysteine peptidase [Aliarcobacter faecis]|uniref:transglutaminase-like cysteine peptidase n=1 Tax=Aliarcobacter faecis TaxID=1564138 RepID=UPI00047EF74D|nr:transglutaminase-like cysteine peptidase [Aliarcobacter faecis]
MKQLIILILLISNSLFAYEFKLNSKDYKTINNSPKKSFIEKRLEKYNELKIKVKDYDLIRKLSHTNSFINKILPQFDNKSSGIDDYWATPKEFLINGHGDCEDYAIAKYFTLLELGIKKENLYFAVVDIKANRGSHMILLYSENKNESPLVMDNLSSVVIPFSKRVDLTPRFAFNEIDSYSLTNDKFIKKITINWGKENKWEKLLNRVYTLNE